MRVEQEKKTGNVESVTLEQVPMEERKSWADVAMIQAGIMICVPSLMLGGILAESMPMSQAIWSGVIGYAVIVALMIFCGIMGSDLGVPTCVVASGVFGKTGIIKADLCIIYDLHDRLVCSAERCLWLCIFQSDRSKHRSKNPDSGINGCVGNNHAGYSCIWNQCSG